MKKQKELIVGIKILSTAKGKTAGCYHGPKYFPYRYIDRDIPYWMNWRKKL